MPRHTLKLTMPHQAQYAYPESHILFVIGWLAVRTFLVDLSNSVAPNFLPPLRLPIVWKPRWKRH